MSTRILAGRLALCLAWLTGASVANAGSRTFTSQEIQIEPSLRRFGEQYSQAYASKNADAIRQLWDPKASDVQDRMKALDAEWAKQPRKGQVFSVSVAILRGAIASDQAIVRLRFMLSYASVDSAEPPNLEIVRIVRCVKANDTWRILHDFDETEDLADRIVAAKRNAERDALLTELSAPAYS